jgi:hypothetical protein
MSYSSSGNSSRSSGRVTRSRAGSIEDEVVEPPSKSFRRIQYCTELLPRKLVCSGCCLYLDSAESSKKGPREVTHTGPRYKCRMPWKQDASKVGYFGDNRHEVVQAFIQKEHGISAGRMDSRRRIHLQKSKSMPPTKKKRRYPHCRSRRRRKHQQQQHNPWNH